MNDVKALRLRDADLSDLPALAQLHVATFNETHGPGPDYHTRLQQWRAKFSDLETLLFCVVLQTDENRLVGFASGEHHANEELSSYRGELNKLYLLREYQGQGLGRVLLCAATGRFLRRGITSMLLFGDARSPANGFYEAMGGRKLYSANGEFHGGYGWADLRELSAPCAAVSSHVEVQPRLQPR